MGQAFSNINVGNNPHAWIQNPRKCDVTMPTKHFKHPKPHGLDGIDDLLWNEFSTAIDKHVSRIDRGMKCAVYLLIVLVLAYFAIQMMRSFVRFKIDESMLYFIFLGIYFVGVIGLIFFLMAVRSKNQEIDVEIKNVCDAYGARFESKGYLVEYLTEHTGPCRPKGARAARVIVFPPVPNFHATDLEEPEKDDVLDMENWLSKPT